MPQKIINLQKPLQMGWPSHASAFISFTDAMRSWMLSTNGPTIATWLDQLWLKTVA